MLSICLPGNPRLILTSHISQFHQGKGNLLFSLVQTPINLILPPATTIHFHLWCQNLPNSSLFLFSCSLSSFLFMSILISTKLRIHIWPKIEAFEQGDLQIIFLFTGTQSHWWWWWHYVGSLDYIIKHILFVFILCAFQTIMIYIIIINLTEFIWIIGMIQRFLLVYSVDPVSGINSVINKLLWMSNIGETCPKFISAQVRCISLSSISLPF